MRQSFKVIEVKINERDGDSYEYVTKIDVNQYGEIVIVISPNVFNAMKFSDYSIYNEQEKENRKQMLNLVKTYFPKKNHTISYRTLTVEVIVDDDSDMCDYQLFNFVQTDTYEGITERDAKLCIDILNGVNVINPIRMNDELKFRWRLHCRYPEIENDIEKMLENYRGKF